MSLVQALAGRVLRNVHAGTDKLASRRLVPDLTPSIALTSPLFAHGDRLPIACTLDGDGVAPSLSWEAMRGAASSFALICEDPDAPFPQPFVHWIVYDIPGHVQGIEPVHPWPHGKNSLLQLGYAGASPPPGHGTHHYHFQLFALDLPRLPAMALGRRALLSALRGHVVAWGELVARYGRGTGSSVL